MYFYTPEDYFPKLSDVKKNFLGIKSSDMKNEIKYEYTIARHFSGANRMARSFTYIREIQVMSTRLTWLKHLQEKEIDQLIFNASPHVATTTVTKKVKVLKMQNQRVFCKKKLIWLQYKHFSWTLVKSALWIDLLIKIKPKEFCNNHHITSAR